MDTMSYMLLVMRPTKSSHPAMQIAANKSVMIQKGSSKHKPLKATMANPQT